LPETAAILEVILAILMNEKQNFLSSQPFPPSRARGIYGLVSLPGSVSGPVFEKQGMLVKIWIIGSGGR